MGATHSTTGQVFVTGQLASEGVEQVAETGGKTLLLAELGDNSDVSSIIDGGGIADGTGSVSVTFTATSTHPLLSVISMVAPSPDWFVGVNSVSLIENGDWVDSQTINLRVYDSGTDSQEVFSPSNGDDDTVPAAVITRLSSDAADTDFLNGIGRSSGEFIGTFTITKI